VKFSNEFKFDPVASIRTWSEVIAAIIDTKDGEFPHQERAHARTAEISAGNAATNGSLSYRV
jgi:hypothetical protein